MKYVHVLVVDDDEWLASEYARTLNAAGMAVSHANNAIEAIEVINNKLPTCIVLDLFMPGPNGLVLLHELQSHSDLSHIPIVLITNAANDIAHDVLRSYGVVQILDKATMQPDSVLGAVKKAIL